MPAFAVLRRDDFANTLNWVDQDLADGRPFIAGERFTVADITGMATLVLAAFARYDVETGRPNLSRWVESVRARPSFPDMPRAQPHAVFDEAGDPITEKQTASGSLITTRPPEAHP